MTVDPGRAGSLFDDLETHRDNRWLDDRLGIIRSVHFADVAHGYPIEIRFGIRARYRFGSIAARNGRTIILINRLFANPDVPAFVVDGTIAHEMAHYAHGFGSGLPRLHVDPHRGGVVDRELAIRGLAEVELKAEEWLKLNWSEFYALHCGDLQAKRDSSEETTAERWQKVVGAPGARTAEELRQHLHRALRCIGTRAGEPVFEVNWLLATARQTGTSYWFSKAGTVKLHGLLADRRVPDYVVEFELAYWAVRLKVGGAWPTIHHHLIQSGLGETASLALSWRRSKWNSFRKRNHPLMKVT